MRSPRKLLSFVTVFSLFLSTNSSICLAASLPIVLAPLSIVEESFALPDAKVGTKYEYQFQSEGGLAPLTWKFSKGQLPPGLNLESSGKLHGVPIQAHREGYTFLVEVADSSHSAQKATMSFWLMVQAAPLRIVTASTPARLRILTRTGDQAEANGSLPSFTGFETNGPQTQHSDSLRANADDSADSINARLTTAASVERSITSSAQASRQDLPSAPTRPNSSARPEAPARNGTTGSQPVTTPATSPTSTTTNSSETEEPEPTPEPGKAKLCGRLRPASLDRILAMLTPELEIFQNSITEFEKIKNQVKSDSRIADNNKESEIEKRVAEKKNADNSPYPATLLYRIHNHSRFGSDVAEAKVTAPSCEEKQVESGKQKEAVVQLLFWLLIDKNWSKVSQEIRHISGGSSPELSKDVVRRQILQLNQYLGNVTARIKNSQGKVVTAVSDRDGNFLFKEVPTTNKNDPEVITLSTEGDDEYTQREFSIKDGDEVRLDLPIEDRPVSLMARTVVGYQQAGAAATDFEQNYFLDFFLSKSLPFLQQVSPDFGERGRIWGAIRAISVPNTDNFTIGDGASSFVTKVAALKVRDAARVFDYLGGIEYRIGGNNALLPSFDRQTKQKFSFSLIASFGFVTPTNPLEKEPPVYSITPQLKQALIERKILTGKDDDPNKGKTNAAFVPNDRDRFFRQYYGGIRVQTYFFNRHNVPMQRFPAQLDFTIGQNEYVTGGRFNGAVMRLDGYYPLPYEKLKFINLFGTAVFKPARVRENTPLILKPADSGIKPFDDSVLIVPVSQFNRDYYRVGIGIDFLSFVQQLLNRN